MKIENIIDDIIEDTIEIKNNLEEKMKKEYPGLNFTIELPGLNQLSAIKVIELSVPVEDTIYKFSVNLHTHNGNRVFEHNASAVNQSTIIKRHPLQDSFINLLRDIIKKKKIRAKAGCRPANLNKQPELYKAGKK